MLAALAHPLEGFPLTAEGGSLPYSSEAPTGPNTRPWILRHVQRPDATQAIVKPAAVYDEQAQMSISIYDGPLPYMATHSPTVPDGNVKNPPPLDEGAKD
ncbi:hypothetical protein [Streptomyces palmae]|uniref:ATP-grasp-modified RiPP n=1 Tax=Streptomyces palmae TaxID=1701085 RepID=A0A4Z0HH94_9ACTN|nr:hypothetical protein [Streptomyces palmae]TGB19372.1 hypothetical protein E4099_00630 [Streptomyces palmae]